MIMDSLLKAQIMGQKFSTQNVSKSIRQQLLRLAYAFGVFFRRDRFLWCP